MARRANALIRLCCLLGMLLTAGGLRGAFERPSAEEQSRALGDVAELPESLRPLFLPDGDFNALSPPRPNDWLTQHREAGQTFDDYRDHAARPADAVRKVIYLLPMGEFSDELELPLDELKAYAADFFQLEVRVLPAYYPHDLEFSPRKNPRSGQRQIRSTEILDFLQTQLPPDACCLLGVTSTDLYPSRTWNYVFGQASVEERVGIYSLARYDPAFWGDERGATFRDLILRRACKVLTHETAHMFGLRHCIYYECVVNGSNNLDETDRAPLHLCPVCLHKLHFATNFDPTQRYEALARFYYRQKWYDDFDFIKRQLTRCPHAPTRAAEALP